MWEWQKVQALLREKLKGNSSPPEWEKAGAILKAFDHNYANPTLKSQLFFAGTILLFASSCNMGKYVSDDSPMPVQKDNDITQDDSFDDSFDVRLFTNKITLDNLGLDALTLAYYQGTTEIYKTTLEKRDAGTTYAELYPSLPDGSYTMVVIGYNGSDNGLLTLTSPTQASFEGDIPDSFLATEEVNGKGNIFPPGAALKRVVSKVQVHSTDNRTADATKIRMTFSGGSKGFNPTTGLATSNKGFSKTVQCSEEIGSTITASSYLFLASDEQMVDVTIETLDTDDNVLFTRTIKKVPLKRNRIVTLNGNVFSK